MRSLLVRMALMQPSGIRDHYPLQLHARTHAPRIHGGTIDNYDTEPLNRDEVSSVHRETRHRARRNSVLIETA